MRSILSLAFGSCLLAAAGCVDIPYATAVAVEDSAGVRVVTTLSGAETVPARPLTTEPVAELGGGASPEVPLHRVSDVRPLGGGRMAVGTASPPRALVFREDGTLHATLGGEGDGPGEFRDVASVVALGGDSLAVWDQDRRRMSVFGPDGRYARDVDLGGLVPLSPRAAPGTSTPAGFTRLLHAGPGSLVAFVVGVWGFEDAAPGAHRMEMPSHRIDADGRELASYGPFPGYELYIHPDIGPSPYPFGADTYAAFSGDALVVGTAEAPEIRFYAPGGALAQIVRWRGDDRTTDGSPLLAEFAEWRDEQISSREPREQEFFRQVFEGMPPPETLPAYRGIVADRESGEVWVGDYPGQLDLMSLTEEVRPVPARRWLVFDSDGLLVATVRTPERFDPYAVHEGRVWGVYRDTLDVESVRAYGVVKP